MFQKNSPVNTLIVKRLALLAIQLLRPLVQSSSSLLVRGYIDT